jgi:microcystin-dependent protein
MADYNINAVTRRVVYDGSSGLGPYAFNFEVLDANDINVYFNTTLLTITDDYTVTINANGKGSVSIVTGTNVPSTPVAADQITIIGSRDIERTTDFVTAGDLRAAALNEQLDALTIFDQQISERVDRSVQFPSYEPAGLNYTVPDLDNRKSKYLAFDSNGELSTLAGTSAPLASVDTAVIVDNAVTTAKLADNSVTSAKIVDGTIATADIADDAVTAAKFNISGNGTSGQVVQSDGDGSFSYLTLATGFVSGMLMPYAGASAPSGWLLCYGQAISRTTYADLFTALGTTYGVGDGSTTFNLPDLRGRVVAGQDDMGGSSANRLTDAVTGGLNGDTLGDTGGTESHTLTSAQSGLVGHTHGVSASLEATTGGGSSSTGVDTAEGAFQGNNAADNTSMINVSISAVASADASEAHNIVQPTIILNYIIKE